MLKDIKSLYFLKKIFEYIYRKKKLKLVKYNKTKQYNIDISIIYCKYFTGKYIIYGANGTGQEYDWRDNLLFKGDYSNGEKNGKGKEYNPYNSSNVLFEV